MSTLFPSCIEVVTSPPLDGKDVSDDLVKKKNPNPITKTITNTVNSFDISLRKIVLRLPFYFDLCQIDFYNSRSCIQKSFLTLKQKNFSEILKAMTPEI